MMYGTKQIKEAIRHITRHAQTQVIIAVTIGVFVGAATPSIARIMDYTMTVTRRAQQAYLATTQADAALMLMVQQKINDLEGYLERDEQREITKVAHHS